MFNFKAMPILGSENCQSISFQNLLSASLLLRVCDLRMSLLTGLWNSLCFKVFDC